MYYLFTCLGHLRLLPSPSSNQSALAAATAAGAGESRPSALERFAKAIRLVCILTWLGRHPSWLVCVCVSDDSRLTTHYDCSLVIYMTDRRRGHCVLRLSARTLVHDAHTDSAAAAAAAARRRGEVPRARREGRNRGERNGLSSHCGHRARVYSGRRMYADSCE